MLLSEFKEKRNMTWQGVARHFNVSNYQSVIYWARTGAEVKTRSGKRQIVKTKVLAVE